MAGNPITEQRMLMMDDMGEEEVFAMYVEIGTVRGLCDELFEAHGEGAKRPSVVSLYKWLHSVDGRYERWVEIKKLRGDLEFDEAYETAKASTAKTVQSDRLKVDVNKWRAGILNRDELGDKVVHEVKLAPAQEWIDALDYSDELDKIQELECEVIGLVGEPVEGEVIVGVEYLAPDG